MATGRGGGGGFLTTFTMPAAFCTAVMTSRSRSGDIQMSHNVAAEQSFFFSQWFTLRCRSSTVITACSITPRQGEKYINTGCWQNPRLTREWENYPAPSCPDTFSLQGNFSRFINAAAFQLFLKVQCVRFRWNNLLEEIEYRIMLLMFSLVFNHLRMSLYI